MGRSADCDVVVQDIASSRHHARVTVGGMRQVVYIEDLKSRNGTYVNEVRISGRTLLEDGSRVRIGATVYLLSLEESRDNDDPMEDTGTQAFEWLSLGKEIGQDVRSFLGKGPSSTDFSGQLGSFSLIEVLQLLNQAVKSGTLNVALETGHARIEIRRGEVHSAFFQELQGFDAVLMLVRERVGMFWLEENDDECRRNIHTPSATLLLELCRAMDEREIV